MAWIFATSSSDPKRQVSNYLVVVFLSLNRKRERVFSDENQGKVKYRYLRPRNADVLLPYSFAGSVLRVDVGLVRALVTIRLSAADFFEPDSPNSYPTLRILECDRISGQQLRDIFPRVDES